MAKQIRLNAFDMNCVAHQSSGRWRHPRDQSWYKDLDYWLGLARVLERGNLTAFFLADVLGVYDVYGSTAETALRNATQIPVNDPFLYPHSTIPVDKPRKEKGPFSVKRCMLAAVHLE